MSLKQQAGGPGGQDRVCPSLGRESPRAAPPPPLSPGCSGREQNLSSWKVLLTWLGARGWGLPRS